MQYFGDDIAGQLRLVRKKRWSTQEERRIAEEIELQVSGARSGAGIAIDPGCRVKN